MTLTNISCSSDFYTFYVEVPLSLGCIILKVSAEDITNRGNGTGLEYMCPTRHFVYIFFNPIFQLSTAKNEINLLNNHILIVAPVTFASAVVMTPSAEFLFNFIFCKMLEKLFGLDSTEACPKVSKPLSLILHIYEKKKPKQN